MPGIHRERPGADAIAPATDDPAIDVGDGVWLSPGLSNSYLITTSDGRVVVNSGMGFEGPLHRRTYDAVDDSPIRAVILTQGHYDHVGGLPVLVDVGTDLIAQANHRVWRDDNRRLEAFRSRNSAFAWIDAILAAMEHTRALGVEAASSELPEPTMLVDERLELTVGDRELVLIATPGGETFDSLVIWLPATRTLLSGNLTGPLFGHVPNLVTIRGDRYR
ncbi:MAG TPA: MBL fold metallo-hydrolase, partial [Acidimicrobiales bacterium]|nr:MBL fold metallo-hydrolase [Acidimicrobiales bacterium]